MTSSPNTPRHIGRYEIESEIGRGGMAVVYLARDPQMERRVAIKMLGRAFLHDPDFLARFRREARLIAALEHRAIVPVYDFGEHEERPYLVMRYMYGGSLADRLARGPLSLSQALEILASLASGLDEAHRQGIVHRDLKPANILFDQYDKPYLADFGIAKLIASHSTLTKNAIIGSPAYMSPEQARGEENIDGRSDIYALGAIMFEMLTGRVPYKATNPSGQMVRHITDPVPNILAANPDLPRGCQTVLARAMAKRASARYPTAAAMVADLTVIVQQQQQREREQEQEPPPPDPQSSPRGVPPQSPPLTPPPGPAAETSSGTTPASLPEPARKRPLWMWLVLFGGLAAVIVLAGLALNTATPGANTPSPTPVPATAAFTPSPQPTLPLAPAVTVLETAGESYFQLPGQSPARLQTGDTLATGQESRIWTNEGSLQFSLPNGAVILIASNTTVTLAPSADEALLTLERGTLLAAGQQIVIRASPHTFRTSLQQGVIGIEYTPLSGTFMLDCLAGPCQIEDEGNDTLALQSGQRGGFELGNLLPAPLEAEYAPWLELGPAFVPTPTPTPIPTATPTHTATPTSTSTATPRPVQPTDTPTPKKGGNKDEEEDEEKQPTSPPPSPTDTPIPPTPPTPSTPYP